MRKRKYNLDSAKDIVSSYGGKLLSEEYMTLKKKLIIKCGCCGEKFERSLEKIIANKSATCKKCSSKRGAKDRTFTINEVKELVEKLGGTLISKEYINARTPVKLKCPRCNQIFSREVQVIKKNKTIICKNCSSSEANDINRLDLEEVKKFIEELGSTLLSEEYVNNQTKLKIKCSCGRIVEKSYNAILKRKNARCKICTKLVSNGEQEIFRLLEHYKIDFKHQHIFDGCKYEKALKFDFYIPSLNIAIEYDGELHYRTTKMFGGIEKMKLQQKRDEIKNLYCFNNKIKLLRIPYWEFKNIKDILEENKIIPSQA